MVLAFFFFFSLFLFYAKVERLMNMEPKKTKKKKKRCSHKKDLNFYLFSFWEIFRDGSHSQPVDFCATRPFFFHFLHWLKCLSSLFLVWLSATKKTMATYFYS